MVVSLTISVALLVLNVSRAFPQPAHHYFHYAATPVQRHDASELRNLSKTGRHGTDGGSVAEWLACWTQAQEARVQIAVATLSVNSLRQTVHTHRASVHQAAKLVAALLRVARVTAGLAESNGSLPPGL